MEILPVIKLESQIEEDKTINADIESCEEEECNEDNDTMYDDDITPTVKEKESIPEEDIFVEKKKPVQKKPVKLKKNGEPRKEATPEQLARLKANREKALAVRRAKSKEKKEIEELHAKKKKKDIEKLREEVSDKPKHTPPATQPSLLQSLDPEVIRKLQLDAIEGYEKVRKERKAKKKEAEQQYARDTTNMNVINNALNPPKPVKYGDSNFFSHLF